MSDLISLTFVSNSYTRFRASTRSSVSSRVIAKCLFIVLFVSFIHGDLAEKVSSVPFFDKKKTLFSPLVCLVYCRYVSCAALVLRRDSPGDIDFPAPKTHAPLSAVHFQARPDRPVRPPPLSMWARRCSKGGRQGLFNGRSSRHANVAYTRTATRHCAMGEGVGGE